MALLAVTFDVEVAGVDERQRPGEDAASYVERLAREKAAAVSSADGAFVLAADTSVVVDGEVLGKPGDDARLGAAMLRRLAGRGHRVLTGVALTHLGTTRSVVVSTQVEVRALSEEEIAWYVASGEGHDKAGGYAVQGRAGAFVSAVRGSPSNVIGLPLAETAALLADGGFPLPWARR